MRRTDLPIERCLFPRQTLADFAIEHGLTLIVRERSHHSALSRFYATFPNVELKEGRMLVSTFGDGDTEAEAIAAYAAKLSTLPLVIDAYRKTRKELVAPVLTYEPGVNGV